MNGLVEVVPDRLYRLGGVVEVDERISWLPEGRPGFEPINLYVLREGDRTVIVDTGAALHGDAVIDQLRALLPAGSPVSLFLTRAEFDCIGNLDRIAAEFSIETIHSGGQANPFEVFDELQFRTVVEQLAMMAVMEPGAHIGLGDRRSVWVVRTALRLLATAWAYDDATGTLFTSDTFGHLGLASASQSPLAGDAPPPDVRDVREHLVAKFNFLPSADTTDIRQAVAEIFARHDVAVIAPTHGCVLVGADQVHEHLALVDRALAMSGEDFE